MTKFAIIAASLTVAASLLAPMATARAESKEPEKHADAPKAAEHGTITGIVISNEHNKLQVKDADGKTETYVPKWIGGAPKDGGGPDKEMAGKLEKVNVGDKVKIEWSFEEHRRILAITVVEKAGQGGLKDNAKDKEKHEHSEPRDK